MEGKSNEEQTLALLEGRGRKKPSVAGQLELNYEYCAEVPSGKALLSVQTFHVRLGKNWLLAALNLESVCFRAYFLGERRCASLLNCFPGHVTR